MGVVPAKPPAKIELVPTKDGRGMFLVSGGELTKKSLRWLIEMIKRTDRAFSKFGASLRGMAPVVLLEAQQKQAPPQKRYNPKKHRPAPSWPAVETPSTWRPKKLADLKSEEENHEHEHSNRSVQGAGFSARPVDPERRD